jgi:type III restriction enzyme
VKFQFSQNLSHQKAAWEAVVGLFDGQESCAVPFTMPQLQVPVKSGLEQQSGLSFEEDARLGAANRLVLSEEELLDNLRRVQLKHGLKPAKAIDKDDLHYTVEMETGTGKTYVYLRSMYELNQAYGMSKFIIVVPSIAIKEGVKKSIEITREHLSDIYKGVNAEAFVYDSANLEQVRNFAESSHIQIMVINIDAFRKSFTDPSKETSANIIHRANDRLEGMRPIELIAKTHPVVIIDEPQSVDTTAKSAEAIQSLNPLFTLRYSATHREKHQPIYKLDAVDAYNQKLVKQIAVLPVLPEDDNNNAYLKLVEVRNKKGVCEARLEFDALTRLGKVSRESKWLKQGADLHELTHRDVYEGYIIKDISAIPGHQWVDFTSVDRVLAVGESVGGVDDLALKRLQINKTIEKHLERELVLNPKGIKVLSLFFIDKVANYRVYDEQGQPGLGVYGRMFEEEFLRLAKHPKYASLFGEINLSIEVEKIHNGYFSADKKGVAKDTNGTTQADESVYDLIMKDKERLLDMNTPLRFIFSHSALREGWDNPNVFQICTLNETASTIKKRQEIGRGLRLAVDRTGNRVTDAGFSINTLTVIANESYHDFTAALQKEIEEEDGIKFGVVEEHAFANLVIAQQGDEVVFLGTEDSATLWSYLKSQEFIDKGGKVQDRLRIALKHNTLSLPSAYQPYQGTIERILRKAAGGLDVKDASKTHTAIPKKEVLLDADFQALWQRIKYKTVYQVNFDLSKLIEACVHELRFNLLIAKPKFKTGLAQITMDHYQGVGVEQIQENPQTTYDAHYATLPDVLTYLQNKTQLTRKTLAQILVDSGRLKDFVKNPQKFTEKVLEIILRKKMHALVDGIKYEKIGAQSYYAQELFLEEELKGYLEQNMLTVEKSVYSHILYDSATESNFATEMEQNESVKLYTKLPSWFKIETPLGSYNPDWAVLIEQEGSERLYFVVETKSSLFAEDRRQSENDKIKCGAAHFEALDNDLRFVQASKFEELEMQY